MSKSIYVAIIILICSLIETKSQTIEYKNGKWFNGFRFINKTFFTVGYILTEVKPCVIDSIIDLNNRFVIPPFGEAHNHNVEGYWDIDEVLKKYILDGVYYVKIQNNIQKFSKDILYRVNNVNSIDVIFSNGCLTSSRGHPITLYNQLYELQYKNYVPNPSWFENKAYYIVDNEDDLKNKWKTILSKNPDFIKIMFSYTEDRDENLLNNSPYVRLGLKPEIASLIVKQAHKYNLKVSAHIETNADFHFAIEAGVDEISHLPGYYIHTIDKRSIAPIFENDAIVAARKGIKVVTTTVLSKTILRDTTLLPIVQKYQIQNLRLLNNKGVELLIGSDHSETSLEELYYLRDLKIFDNLSLLKMLCENTPRSIFPKRKIGYLKEGYEASFLVLDKNPLMNLDYLRNIVLRIKQGHFLKQ